MSSSLRLRLKFISRIALVLFLIAFSLQVSLSLIINKSKNKIIKQARETLGYPIHLKNISFSFIKGLHLKGASIFYDEQKEPPILLRDAFVSIGFLPLFLGKIYLNINVNESALLMKKEKEGYSTQIIFSDISKRMSKLSPPLINASGIRMRIKTTKLIYAESDELRGDLGIFYKNIRILFYKTGGLKFNSDIKIEYRISKNKYLSRLLRADKIQQELKCSLQGELNGRDLRVDLLQLNISGDQLIGTGLIKDFTERNPYIDLDFVHSAVFLNAVALLKNNFQAQGSIFASIRLAGLMDNIKVYLAGQLNDCYLKYNLSDNENIDLKNLNGKIEFEDNRVKLDLKSLNINNLPLSIKMAVNLNDEPEIFFNFYLAKDFFAARNIPVEKLEASFEGKVKNEITGKLEIRALYVKKGLNFDLGLNFKNIEFDYAHPKEKYFKAQAVELTKVDSRLWQRLTLDSLSSNVLISKDKVQVKDIRLNAYGGILNGEMNWNLKDKNYLTCVLKGSNLDVSSVMRDTNITNKLISGELDIKIIFDNRLSDLLKGRCYVKRGAADLDALGSAVKFPSLKNTNFNIMNAYFAFTRDLIKVRGIKLYSKDIMLNAFWDIDEKIKGAINIKASSELLNQSPAFKKLLNLVDFKKPYIDFKFLLGGISRAARVKWAKGEFKEKLEEELSGWVKRSIQANLNEAIEGVSNK